MGATASETLHIEVANTQLKTLCAWEGHKAPLINPSESSPPPESDAIPYPMPSSGTIPDH